MSALIAGAVAAGPSIAVADGGGDDENEGRTYSVTITNLTRGQVVTPPLVIVHSRAFTLFTPGAAASEGLATLAETGNPGPLAADVELAEGVAAVAVGDVLPPGQSITMTITSARGAKFLSLAAMLATTNDAFASLRAVRLPKRGRARSVRALAYDAGSEANNESCDFIPGPPCNGTNERDTAGAEGFIHVHAGVHGVADLVPADQDWRNPVLSVVIERRHSDDD
ncbi:MAG: hypothetical protein D6826_00140 [Alphaproteobacteria bacterium]|nr:MAG: hypothetical protein D6826_00140 [Alphaproteobacteria bacterium]